MKTILQTRSRRTAKLALLLTLICAAVPTLQAQGPFIVENTNLQVDNTIIRTVSDTSWLIYSEHGNRGVFSLMTESSMIAQVMDLGYRTVKVNDFEIINNIVYFCGETVGTFPTKAVLGMFNLYTFIYISQLHGKLCKN